MNEQLMNMRETLRGMGIRAGVLAVGGLVVGGLVTAATMKAAGTLMQLAAGGVLVLSVAGFATYEARKISRRLATA